VPLLIAEEFLLVAHRADGSSLCSRTTLQATLGGALLVELVLGGNATLDREEVVAMGTAPTPAEPALAEALAQVAAKPRRPKACVQRLSKGAPDRVRAGLIARGVLVESRARFLGVVPIKRYQAAEPALGEAVLARLRASVIDGATPDERTAALASLVHAARLGRQVFPDADRRAVNRRLTEIADGDWAADAVRKAIRAAQAATSAAVAAASSSATSGS
jgi:hypothetical protein